MPKFRVGDRVQVYFSRSDLVAGVIPDRWRLMKGAVVDFYDAEGEDSYNEPIWYYTVRLDGNEWGGWVGERENFPERVLRPCQD